MKCNATYWGHSKEEWAEMVAGGAYLYGRDQELVDAIERNRIAFAAICARNRANLIKAKLASAKRNKTKPVA